MRVVLLALTVLLASAMAVAQEGAPPQHSNSEPPLNLPVSLERIREMLAEPQAPDLLGTLNGVNATTFRVDITEQAKLDDLMAALRFEKPGPQVAGGNDAYEQYQRLFPPVDNPLVQPYAAFSTRQVIPLAVEALIEKYVVDRIADVAAPASHKD